jgi:hypothetical protein
MNIELANYDIQPRIVPSGRPMEITIRSLGAHAAFEEGCAYIVQFMPMTESLEQQPDVYESADVAARGGALRFTHAFPGEQEHYVRIFRAGDPPERVANLSVYSLLPDLFRLRPYRGDFHVHTCRSDGKEAPAVVAANYRKAGFDFLAITDHSQWLPSEEALSAWQGRPVDLRLFHGEEVHAPGNHIHIVNFGGGISANAAAYEDDDRYGREVAQIQSALGALPAGVDAFEYASCLWSAAKIREGGGMAIFAHPHWIADVYHVRDAMTRHIFETMPFDAFELLGGQTVHENNMQLAIYHDARARGLDIPIVGSSDSHGTVGGHWFNWISSVVFAESCERDAVIRAVKGGCSAALEHYPNESPRAHGSYRMVSYARFLLANYFPLHDELCFEEGRAMKDLICGDESAMEILKVLQGRTGRFMERCFGK